MSLERIAVYGGGGSAREVAWLVESSRSSSRDYQVVCFIEDDQSRHGRLINGVPSMSLDEARLRFSDALVVGGVGSPVARQRLMTKAGASGFGFATIIHPLVQRSEWITFGTGTVICAGCVLTTNITIGEHVQVNLNCTITHDAVLGDYTTLAPGVHVSGWVHMGKRVYIGTGASIINGTEAAPIVLGDDAVVGAGACVTKSVDSGSTVVGVPAKPLLPKVDRVR